MADPVIDEQDLEEKDKPLRVSFYLPKDVAAQIYFRVAYEMSLGKRTSFGKVVLELIQEGVKKWTKSKK